MTLPNCGFSTELEFKLPKGYLDKDGNLHRHGIMRLATAMDELSCYQDIRVRQNEAYMAVILLAKVITQLGSVSHIDVKVIEGLFASDFDYLQRLYEKFNSSDESDLSEFLSGQDRGGNMPRRLNAVGEA